jgi:flagellar hook protein FlgE
MGMDIDTSAITKSYAKLNLIGHNISNQNTIGYKSSSFVDILGQSTSVQNFKGGAITADNNPLDVAISGKGFFKVLSANGQALYTRDGRFQLDANNNLIDSKGNFVQSSTGTTINIPPSIPAKASSTGKMTLNLDSSATVPSTATFSPTDTTSYNKSTTTKIYDSTGKSSTVTSYFVKTSTGYDIYSANSATPTVATKDASLIFDANGNLNTASPLTVTKDDVGNPTVDIPLSGAPGVIFTFDNPTLTKGPFTATSTADGYSTPAFANLTIGADGAITPNYVINSQPVAMPLKSMLGIYVFPFDTGLTPVGVSDWAETVASGTPTATYPGGENGAGSIQTGATEGSNVDTTAAMVDLLSAQRAFQAESQVVNTQSQILQEVAQLGR